MAKLPAASRPAPPFTGGDQSRATDIVTLFAATIGARPAGSTAERRAADAAAAAFESAGIASVQLPVRVRAPGSWDALFYAPLGLLAVLCALPQPFVGLGLALVVTLGCGADLSGRRLLTHLVPRRSGRNVLAIVPPARQEIRRLVVMANLDTVVPSSATRFSTSAGAMQSGAQLLAALASSAVLLAARLFVEGAASTGLALAAAAGPLLWLLRAGWLDWRASGSPGAITNASGVAALVALAEHVLVQPAQWVEVWFLATSGGEARGDGLRAFLSANQFETDATYFVQLQSVGAGELAFATRDGILRDRAASPTLARLLAESGVERPPLAARPLRALRRATQTAVALRAGYDAITLVGVDERGVIPLDGSEHDMPGAVDGACIERAVGLLIGVLERLDAEATERNRLALLARASAAAHSSSPDPLNE